MADLDNLIDELFPGDDANKSQKPTTAPKDAARLASEDNWDSASDHDDDGLSTRETKPHAGAKPVKALPQRKTSSGGSRPEHHDSKHASAGPNPSHSSSLASTPNKSCAAKANSSAKDSKPTPIKKLSIALPPPKEKNASHDDSSSTSSSSTSGSEQKHEKDDKPIRATKRPAAEVSKPAEAARHSFDDDSDDDAPVKAPPSRSQQKRPGAGRLTDPSAKAAAARHSTTKETASALERPSTAQRVLFTVPFPSAPPSDSVSPPCPNRCVMSNVGCEKKPHPSLDLLHKVAKGAFDTSCDKKEMLIKKGAFYVKYPEVGNGVRDNGGDPSEKGGCPNVFCLKCHHTVVRLQGAQWCDHDSDDVDLYLTMRNFYPDWSRLATSNVVGTKSDAEQGLALKSAAGCAAYCCQCSWLTVKTERGLIETSLTAAVTYKNSDQPMPFSTAMPRHAGDERRPPLWVCKGHAL